MPDCPHRTAEERKHDRWELVVGKALKDWVTAVMLEKKLTRAEARLVVLAEIRQKGEGHDKGSNNRTERIRSGGIADYARRTWGRILAYASPRSASTSASPDSDLH